LRSGTWFVNDIDFLKGFTFHQNQFLKEFAEKCGFFANTYATQKNTICMG